MSASVYTLLDPRTGSVRYVGWTTKTPGLRLKQHIWEARRGDRAWKSQWIRRLLAIGQRPAMRVVAVCGIDEGPIAEADLIAAFRAKGVRLVNITDGGEGTPGRKANADTRARMSASQLGKHHSAETRAKIGAIQRRKKRGPMSEAGRTAISRAKMGHGVSEETRAKIAAAKRGTKQSAETTEKRAAALRGRRRPPFSAETRAAMSRAALKRHERERKTKGEEKHGSA